MATPIAPTSSHVRDVRRATHPLLGEMRARGVTKGERKRLKALRVGGAIIKTDAPSIMHRFLSTPNELKGLGISIDMDTLRNTSETRRFVQRLHDSSDFVLYYCDRKGRFWRLRAKK